MSTGEHYFWWNDAQRLLSDEVAEYAASNIVPKIRECEDTKRFPWEILAEIGKKGWYGVLIPKKYGGMGEQFGITGMCIILEEVARGAAIAVDFYETTIYGYTPIVRFGTEEQKQKWLPPLATGEDFACIAITEPFMGSDAAAIQTKMELLPSLNPSWVLTQRQSRRKWNLLVMNLSLMAKNASSPWGASARCTAPTYKPVMTRKISVTTAI